MIRNSLKFALVGLAFAALSLPAMASQAPQAKCPSYLGTGGGKSASCCPYMKAVKTHCNVKSVSKSNGLFQSRGNKN